jgi:hypothetical protein
MYKVVRVSGFAPPDSRSAIQIKVLSSIIYMNKDLRDFVRFSFTTFGNGFLMRSCLLNASNYQRAPAKKWGWQLWGRLG